MIIDRKNLATLIEKLHSEGKVVVTTNGCFDILHLGHVKYLQKSKALGDVLIVLLNSDVSVKKIKGPNRPINKENDRAEVLSALSCVDYVVLFDESSPKNLLAQIHTDIHTKGADYEGKELPEADAVLKNGGRIELIELVEGKSTTNIIEKMNN